MKSKTEKTELANKAQKVNKEAVCSVCKKENNAAISVDNDIKPEENDLSVCYYCGEISKYNKDLTLTSVTKDELSKIEKEDDETWKTILLVKELIKGRNG